MSNEPASVSFFHPTLDSSKNGLVKSSNVPQQEGIICSGNFLGSCVELGFLIRFLLGLSLVADFQSASPRNLQQDRS